MRIKLFIEFACLFDLGNRCNLRIQLRISFKKKTLNLVVNQGSLYLTENEIKKIYSPIEVIYFALVHVKVSGRSVKEKVALTLLSQPCCYYRELC